jgi:hypothetical protein
VSAAVLDMLAVTLVTVTQTWSNDVEQTGGSTRVVVMVPVTAFVTGGVVLEFPPQLIIQPDAINKTAVMPNKIICRGFPLNIVVLLVTLFQDIPSGPIPEGKAVIVHSFYILTRFPCLFSPAHTLWSILLTLITVWNRTVNRDIRNPAVI